MARRSFQLIRRLAVELSVRPPLLAAWACSTTSACCFCANAASASSALRLLEARCFRATDVCASFGRRFVEVGSSPPPFRRAALSACCHMSRKRASAGRSLRACWSRCAATGCCLAWKAALAAARARSTSVGLKGRATAYAPRASWGLRAAESVCPRPR